MYKPTYVLNEKDKAVSPIIATILIVAITVVLAATLYAVIGGYGGLIGKSTPTAGIQVTTSGQQTTVTVNSVSGNLTLSDLKVQITVTGTNAGTWNSGSLLAGANTITIGSSGSTATVTLAVSGGGNYLTGLSTLTFGAPTGSTISSFKIVDTSTSGTVASWPS